MDFTISPLDPVQFASLGEEGTPAPGTSYADLFETALREQLGLKKAGKTEGPAEILW